MTKRTGHMRRMAADERGASIVLALMLVMVCAIVAALIVGSAATNAERGRQHAQEEQAYYAVLSAADQGAALYRAYAPAVRMQLSTLGTNHVRYTTSASTGSTPWRRELETWVALSATGQTKTPFTCTATMVSRALGLGSAQDTPRVEISFQMDPATHDVTVTASQVGEHRDYANTLQQVVPKNSALSSENASERVVSWNNSKAPSLDKSSKPTAKAPKAGSVSEDLAPLYAAWQHKKFDWSSISWKKCEDARGTTYMAVQDKKSKRVSVVWYDGQYYKATFDGADYPTGIDGFDVRDHLLSGYPFYNGETRSGKAVSILWQEVRAS